MIYTFQHSVSDPLEATQSYTYTHTYPNVHKKMDGTCTYATCMHVLKTTA